MLTLSFIHSIICSFIHSFIRSFQFIHSFNFIHSLHSISFYFIHSLIHTFHSIPFLSIPFHFISFMPVMFFFNTLCQVFPPANSKAKKKRPGRQRTDLPPWRFCSQQELTWSPESSPRVIRWIQVHQQSTKKLGAIPPADANHAHSLKTTYISYSITIEMNEGHRTITLIIQVERLPRYGDVETWHLEWKWNKKKK